MIIDSYDLKFLIKNTRSLFLTTVFSESHYGFCNGFSFIYDKLKEKENIKFDYLRISHFNDRLVDSKLENTYIGLRYSKNDLKRIQKFDPETILISLFFSRALYDLSQLLLKYTNAKRLIFGGPGTQHIIKWNSDTFTRKYLNKQKNIYIHPFDIDISLFDQPLNEYALYVEDFDLSDLSNDTFCSVGVNFLKDICYKYVKYKKCIFCTYDHQMSEVSKLKSKSSRKILRSLKGLKRNKNIDKHLVLTNVMSGPTLPIVKLFYQSLKHMFNQNCSLFSTCVFSKNFSQLLKKYEPLFLTEKAQNMTINYGIEVLSDNLRKVINKDYVSSKECLKFIQNTLKYTNFNLLLNFILNVRPMTKDEFIEYSSNLLKLIEYAYKNNCLDRIEFIINIDCEYYNEDIIKRINTKNWPYIEILDYCYVFRRNKYVNKLKELFFELKNHGVNIRLADIQNDEARKDL